MTDNEFKTHHIAMTTDFIETDKPTTILISGSPSRTREIYDKLDIKEKLVETGRALPIGKGFLERTINDEEHKIAVVVGTTGMGFGTTEIVTNEIVDTYAQSIREQNIGLDVTIDVIPPSSLRQGKATGKFSVFRASWIADYPDAENYLSLFYSKNFTPNGPNYTHFKNIVFDSLYEKNL